VSVEQLALIAPELDRYKMRINTCAANTAGKANVE
jgi:hypothetical protein